MSKYDKFWCCGFQWVSLWRSDKFLLTLGVSNNINVMHNFDSWTFYSAMKYLTCDHIFDFRFGLSFIRVSLNEVCEVIVITVPNNTMWMNKLRQFFSLIITRNLYRFSSNLASRTDSWRLRVFVGKVP